MSDISEFLKQLIESEDSNEIFGPSFQSYEDFCKYLTTHFDDCNYDVNAFVLNAPSGKRANKKSSASFFQALFVACWIYKPMEKGTYFLRMTPREAKQVKSVYDKLTSRKSSHLAKTGMSASEGYAFLKGYQELLVQWQATGGRTYLMLKSEGHTTGLTSIVPHLKSWNHKRKTGAGLVANPKLNEIAGQDNPMVARGAENFSTEYKEFLKSLNKLSGNKKVQGALTSVRDMLVALTGASKWAKATNLEVRTQLNTLINTSGNVRGIPLTDGVKEQFKRFSKLFELENRPEKIYHRYFEEVHVNPRHLTFAIEDFRKEDSPIALIATTQRRSQLLTSW